MLLSDRDIRAELDAGGLRIGPLDDCQIQPASVDLRLGLGLRAYQARDEPVDPQAAPPGLAQRISFTAAPGYVLRPGMFVLGCTAETIELPAHLAAQVDGRSTLRAARNSRARHGGMGGPGILRSAHPGDSQHRPAGGPADRRLGDRAVVPVPLLVPGVAAVRVTGARVAIPRAGGADTAAAVAITQRVATVRYCLRTVRYCA